MWTTRLRGMRIWFLRGSLFSLNRLPSLPVDLSDVKLTWSEIKYERTFHILFKKTCSFSDKSRNCTVFFFSFFLNNPISFSHKISWWQNWFQSSRKDNSWEPLDFLCLAGVVPNKNYELRLLLYVCQNTEYLWWDCLRCCTDILFWCFNIAYNIACIFNSSSTRRYYHLQVRSLAISYSQLLDQNAMADWLQGRQQAQH